MNKYIIGKKIKSYREAAGMSQLDLELAIDASPGSLSRIENGKVNPTKETLISIANYIGLNSLQIADLFDIEIIKNSFHYNEIELNIFKIEGMVQCLFENIIQHMLTQFQTNFSFLGCSLSIIEGDYIQLKYFSTNKISEYLLGLLSKEKLFRKLMIKNEVRTKTIAACLSKKVYIGNKLEEYISPPVPNSIAQIIQRVFKIKQILAIPLLDSNQNVIGMVNIANDRDIDNLETQVIQKLLTNFSSLLEIQKKIKP